VHHCNYPQFEESMYNEELAVDMDLVGDVVSRVLSIREKEQIRVRQPLPRLIAVMAEKDVHRLKRFESHILEELNIKSLLLVDSLDEYISYTVKLNFKKVGPKLGGDVKSAAKLLAGTSAKEVAHSVAQGKNVVLGTGDEKWTLEPEDIIIEKSFDEGLLVDENKPVLIVDTNVTEELLREGLARDVVRHIQQMRKDTGLEIQDHITTRWVTDGETIAAAIREHQDYIRRETLCAEMTGTEFLDRQVSEYVKEIKIGDAKICLEVLKAG